MQVSGKIKVIQAIEEKGTFKSRNVVVTTEEQYPQHIAIQFVQDKCSILDSYAVGQSVEVSINLRGREWVDPQGVSKYFNTIQGWKINKVSDAPVAETSPVDEMPF
jgi:membrane carboxypeptidase/penicillin-binding protein